MIAQGVGRTRDYPKERRIGDYDRLRIIPCAFNELARSRAIHETFGLDDQSIDAQTLATLTEAKKKFNVIIAGNNEEREHKTGGLYNNMNYALKEATKNDDDFVLFIQDDMQLVRKIEEKDLYLADQFFVSNKNCAQLQTCFMKRYFSKTDNLNTTLDSSNNAYFRESNVSAHTGFSGFSAVGLFDTKQVKRLFGSFKENESKNNYYAKDKAIIMRLSTMPFMMWLPFPMAHLGRKRNIASKIVENLAGVDFTLIST